MKFARKQLNKVTVTATTTTIEIIVPVETGRELIDDLNAGAQEFILRPSDEAMAQIVVDESAVPTQEPKKRGKK